MVIGMINIKESKKTTKLNIFEVKYLFLLNEINCIFIFHFH